MIDHFPKGAIGHENVFAQTEEIDDSKLSLGDTTTKLLLERKSVKVVMETVLEVTDAG